MILGGYGQLARGLASTPTPLDIRFKQCIDKVSYGRLPDRATPEVEEGPITITCTNGQTIHADRVVMTVSLGVLKAGNIKFEPELRGPKREAISRLGFGLLNKVVLVYDRPFWDTQADFIGCLRTPRAGDLSVQDSYESDRGRFYLIWNCTPSVGCPTLGTFRDSS
jgi:lysine-specific histone demethylase 1